MFTIREMLKKSLFIHMMDKLSPRPLWRCRGCYFYKRPVAREAFEIHLDFASVNFKGSSGQRTFLTRIS